MNAYLPIRATSLTTDQMSPIGIVADCPGRAADVWSSVIGIANPGWSTWGRSKDRIGWIHRGRPRKRWLALLVVLDLAEGGEIGYDSNEDGWLIIDVAPGPRGFGSTIRAKGELDEAMHRSLMDVLWRHGATVIETWDPLSRDPVGGAASD